MKLQTGAITSVQLAELCGVSQGTVDRALNDRPGISPKTKERILKMAEQHGYIKDMRASSLVLGKTKLLGLVVFNLNNEFFTQLASVVETVARQQGYTVMIALSNTDKQLEKECIDRMFSFGADGVLLCPVGFSDEYVDLLQQYKKPILTISNKAGDSIPHVGANEAEAMAQMTREAASKGYENIILYIPPLRFLGQTNIYAQKMRAEGYRSALAECHLNEIIFTDEDSVIAYIKTAKKKTAVLCASDIYALKLMKRCKEEQIKVPEDMGLSGFDNIQSLELFEKRLTTVDYPISEIGQFAVEQIVKLINGEEACNKTCICKLVLGETL